MRREAYEAQLFDRINKAFEAHQLSDCACSAILTGSFGRGEPTYRYSGEDVTLQSDVEIALIYRRSRDGKRLRTAMRAIASEFEEDLNFMAFPRRRIVRRHNYNHTLFTPRYCTLFAYDLFGASRTIWGETLLGRSLPAERIDLYEAKRIVANRIGELLCVPEEDVQSVAVWRAKLLLAIASAYLLCEGAYQSSYRAQHDEILRRKAALIGVLGHKFMVDYQAAFGYLREGADGFCVSDGNLRGYVAAIGDYLQQRGVAKPKTNSLSRRVKYCLRYLRFGGRGGLVGLEERILQALMEGFAAGADAGKYAAMWRAVLY